MRRDRGFNLLEVILASFLFAMVVAFSVSVWITHYKAIGKSRYDMLGMYLATQKIEEQIAKGYSGAGPEGPLDVQVDTTVRGQNSQIIFTYEILEEFLPDPPGPPNMKSMMVIVNWTDPLGNRKEVRLETLLSGSG
jgi:prepilin-type N-terminal cleavage/methylation domain-containing protein